MAAIAKQSIPTNRMDGKDLSKELGGGCMWGKETSANKAIMGIGVRHA
jgi:hypothetical protein